MKNDFPHRYVPAAQSVQMLAGMEIEMKRKWIPPFLMLFAGAVSSIIMFILHYEMQSMLWILLGVLIAFYVIGSLFKWMLDVFERQNEETEIENADEQETEETAAETAYEEEGQVTTEG